MLAVYGYLYVAKPQLLPAALRLGSLHTPMTVLFLGVDVVYDEKLHQRNAPVHADKDAFTGRSDTIIVGRLDPDHNTLRLLAIPRDTQVYIRGYGRQKINAANAIGGPNLALATVSQFLDMPIDHYVVLNVHGLVDLVNELGGITVEVPKRMQYMDWTAKLKIDIEPGVHTLTGNQAMGFVRFRHDALGDIGRVTRQEIFLRAVLDKALQPESWTHLTRLLQIAQRYLCTDLSVDQMLGIANYVRGVPRANQVMTMMPGRFDGGDWQVDKADVSNMVARLNGVTFIESDRSRIRLVIQNSSSVKGVGYKLAANLGKLGYKNIQVQKSSLDIENGVKQTRVIAQKANPEDAELVRKDIGYMGSVVNASVGDIESSVTLVIGDDLLPSLTSSQPGSGVKSPVKKAELKTSVK